MLGMKKTLGLVMATAMVAGCATSPIQVNQVKETTAKVDSVKVSPSVFDLGEKDGASFKMSLKLTGKTNPFGIKAFTPDSFSALAMNPNSFLVLKLHKQGTFGTAPVALPGRFDATTAPATVFTIDGGVSAPVPPSGFKGLTTGVINTTFKGLNFNSAYSISARAYAPGVVDGSANPIPIPTADLSLDVGTQTAGVTTLNRNTSSILPNLNSLNLKPNDFITIGASAASTGARYRVISTTSTSVDVSDPTAVLSGTNLQFGFWRDIAAANQTTGGPGGGTAGAIGTPTENFINVSTAGVVSFGGSGTPTQLDMNFKLMDDFTNAFSKGSVTLIAGTGVSGGETITSP
ncbi:MAG: hypothetical protein U0457_15130 [Candidatus Sericytochromatia bacterium]